MITVYSASAGSGKTYTLTREYLQLALGPEYKFAYRHILAVTFTNKATGEMKARIIKELSSIQKGNQSPMAQEICNLLNITFEVLRQRASTVLSSILHNYSSFAISTIDSFFQKIVRNFTREAGLQTGYKIELDLNYVLEAVTHQVLGKIGTLGNSELDQWIIRLAEEKVEQGEKWDFRQEMIALGKELFRESLMRKEEVLEQLHVHSEEFKLNKNKLYSDITFRKDKAIESALKLLTELTTEGIAHSEFSNYGRGSLVDYLIAISEGKLEMPGSRAAQMIEDPEKCFAKSNRNRNKYIAIIQNKLQPEIKQFVEWLEINIRFYKAAIEIFKNLNILGLIGSIREELKIFREQENVLLLPDTTLLLFKIMQNNDASFIYEKAGNYYKNYLIDEFQDTSKTQWENFKPLIINSLASGEKNLIVGDIKQSIYRWRDGDWRLLYGEFKSGIHSELIQNRVLEYNYRSLPSIIESNNLLFENLPLITAIELNQRIPYSEKNKKNWINQIKGLYQESYQKIPESYKKSETGYYHIHCFELQELKQQNNSVEEEEGENPSWKKLALENLYHKISEFQKSGFPLSSMAILVRTKKEGTEILNYLMDGDSGRTIIPVSTSEALTLESGKSVQLLIQALKFLLDEKDDPAKAALSILWKYEKNENNWTKDWINQSIQMIPEELLNNNTRTQLKKMPIFELINELIRIFRLGNPEWESETGFITGFLDAVLEFLKEENPDPERFLEWWEYFGKMRPIQMTDTNQSIKILTIHKSKGLEFPIVLIPFCDWDILPRANRSPWLWCNPRENKINQMEIAPVKFSSRLSESAFSENYFEEMQLNFADSLNLIYVAFTRPIQALWVGLPVHRNKEGNLSMGRISSHIFQALEVGVNNTSHIRHIENEFIAGALTKIPVPQEQIEFKSQQISLRSTSWMDRLQVKKIARKIPIQPRENKKVKYGIILHALLAQIKQQQDSKKAIQQLIFEGHLAASDENLIQEKLTVLFEHPQIQEWFSGKYEVRTEVDIVESNGNISRPDRIMLGENKIILIDFKTGQIRKSDREQLLGYGELLKQMEYTGIEAWLIYLSSSNPELIKVI
jgi:ATP-dependent exoDNAse (exonuclease V) beta subunit